VEPKDFHGSIYMWIFVHNIYIYKYTHTHIHYIHIYIYTHTHIYKYIQTNIHTSI